VKLAFAMLNVPLSSSVKALEILAESLDASKANQLLEIVAPSWVDLNAARHIAECGISNANKPAVVLNGSTYFCAKMYVQRASFKTPKTSWPIILNDGIHGERIVDEIAADIETALILALRIEEDPLNPNARAQLNLVLQEYLRNKRPVFVAFAYSAPLYGVLREIQAIFPTITFVFLSGEEFPSAIPSNGSFVRLIEPKLQTGDETKAQRDFAYARSLIRTT